MNNHPTPTAARSTRERAVLVSDPLKGRVIERFFAVANSVACEAAVA
jgi:hypothetical protein